MSESSDGPTKNSGYSTKQLSQFLEKYHDLSNEHYKVVMDLAQLAGQLDVPRAKTFANEAMGRRLRIIDRAITNIFNIYPPYREELMTTDECYDVAIQFQVFAINVCVIFDNAAWVCMLQAGGNLNSFNVGLCKKDCKQFFPTELADYIIQPTFKTWFDDYGKLYRDSAAHRIPPYLPTRNYTQEEYKRWQELDRESKEVLFGTNEILSTGGALSSTTQLNKQFEKHEQLEAEKLKVGRNSLLMGLSLTGDDARPPVYFHPQLLCDWALILEFVRVFVEAMRKHYGWESPEIPDVIVNKGGWSSR